MAYKAFVSSTFVDLQDHRRHVIQQLRKAGFTVDPMEDWTASAGEPKKFSTERLEGCHLCVLLVARRLGHVPRGESRSITQMEYDEARRRGIDVLTYLLDDGVPEEEWPWEEQDEVQRWRSDLGEQRGVAFFNQTPTSIEIAPALVRWIADEGPKVALRLYMANVRREHGTIKFVSLPKLEDNPDAPIRRLYVEPAMSQRWISPDTDPGEWPETKPVRDMPDKLVLLGDPGSGKSTLVSWLSWQLASGNAAVSLGETDARHAERDGYSFVPLPMILRDLGVGPGITWDKLLESFIQQPPYSVLTMANVQRILDDGRAMIMLDGLDEIGNPQVRRDLRDAVWRAMKHFRRCRWMLTSRVVGYDEVEFHQKELEYGPDADVERWGRRLGYQTSYLMQKRADLSFIAPFDDARVDEFTHSWFQLRELSEHAALAGAAELLAAIRGDEGTKKLGRIPNLLTMMALIWRIEAHLPNGRALLCHKISEAYLYTIDRWKRIDPRSERLEDRRRWLARVGFEMQRIRGSRSHKTSGDAEEVRSFATSATVESAEIFATGEQVRGWIAAAMKDSGRTAGDAEAAQFVDYLQRRTGLLLERGENRYSFLHLSFQEYFAAWHLKEQIVLPEWIDDEQVDLAPGTSKQALQEYAASPVWRETLVFLIELLAVEQPRWLKRVRKCLFGPDYAIVTSGNDGNQEQTMLLARLANDPQAGFTDDDRWRAIGACCGWEAQRQKNLGDNPWGGSPVVLPVLLSCEPMQRTRIVECLVACLLEVDAEAVTIEFTPFSDLTPLGKLQNLRILDLDSTLVSDLTGLSGLANLQKLILDHTSVSDLTPLSDLATLQVITLQVTPVSDLTSLSRLASLEWLDLSDTPVSDLTPLSGLASLRTLVLRDTPVSEESVAALQNARNQAGLPEISHVIR